MFKKYGFDNVLSMVNNLKKDIEQIQTEPLKQIGLEAEKIAVEHLRNQDLGWKPLSPKYLKYKTTARKGKKRLSEKTLIATGSYLQSITSWATKEVVYVGVKRSVRNKEGEEIANIAKIHEYGSKVRNIPARPLWQPTMQEMKGKIAKGKYFVNAFLTLLKRKYGV